MKTEEALHELRIVRHADSFTNLTFFHEHTGELGIFRGKKMKMSYKLDF
jgi:hypothetical protein